MMRETTAAMAARPGQNRWTKRRKGGAATTDTSWLLCRAGTILSALPIDNVVEIMRMLPLDQIAGAPNYVRGLSIIRGAPVPVVDMGLIIGGEVTPSTRLVAVRAASRTIALAVDEVIGIVGLAADAFGRLPPLLQQAAADTLSAIGALDSELLVFLRTGRLVSEDVLEQIDAARATS